MKDDILITALVTMIFTIILIGCGYFTGKQHCQDSKYLRDGNGRLVEVYCEGDSCIIRPVNK